MKDIASIFVLIIFLISCSRKSAPLFEPADKRINYPIIAHSHNDYEQKTPLYKALNHGFTSIEVDIVYDGKNLRVCHDVEDDLKSKPIFEESYLIPIVEQTSSCDEGVILLVDIKNYSPELLNKLNTILNRYKNCLVSRKNANQKVGKIKIVLSGDIPRKEIIENESNEYLFIDGRLTEFDLNASSEIVPMISMNFTDLSVWNGKGSPDVETLDTIKSTIELVQSKGKIIRFWKTRDLENTWLTLIDLNIDVIGVDDLKHFHEIMKKNNLIK